MRRSYLTGISVLSFMAVLGTAAPAHALFSSFFHEGPATAAAPVTNVDVTPLPPAAGVAVAPEPATVSPLMTLDTQVEKDRKLAHARQQKLMDAMKTATPAVAMPAAPVVAAVAPVAPAAPAAPQTEPLKQLAAISVTQSGESGEVLTPQLLQNKKIEDQNRRTAAAMRAQPAVAIPAVVVQQKKPAVATPAVASVRKPITPAIIHVKKQETPVKMAAKLAAIAPAAGAAEPQKGASAAAVAPAAAAPAPVAAPAAAPSGVDNFIDRIMTYHKNDGAAPARTASPAPAVEKGTLTLEGLLTAAGLSGDSIAPVTGAPTALKWNAGADVSGMYEQLPVQGAFEKQIESYLERYRRDCASGLLSKVGKPEVVAAGSMATAEAGCKDKDNAYVTVFLFLQDGKNFNTVVHSTYPSARGSVFTIRDKMIASLRGAQRFATSFAQKDAETKPSNP